MPPAAVAQSGTLNAYCEVQARGKEHLVTPKEKAEDSKKRLQAVVGMTDDKFAKWQYFENRADRLGERLWSVGVWLLALVGAALSLPFVAQFVKPIAVCPWLHIENRVGLALLAAFGVLICVYSYFALRDLRDHIESNWRKAGNILEGKWESEWKGRKSHGLNVLFAAGVLALIAFLTLLLLALSRWPNF
jgi:hypothetical protein